MPKTIVYDILNLEGAEVQVDLIAGQIALRVRYNIVSSGSDVALAKQQDMSSLLSVTERMFMLNLAKRLKAALEARELV